MKLSLYSARVRVYCARECVYGRESRVSLESKKREGRRKRRKKGKKIVTGMSGLKGGN